MNDRNELLAQLAEARQELAQAQAQLSKRDAPATNISHYHILDHILEGCQIIGFDWRYLYINEKAARHGHHTPSELVGHTMMEMYPGIEQTDMFRVLQRCMDTRELERLENEFTYPDGHVGWFELSIQPVPEGIFILSLDITQHKLAETNLQRYTKHLETLHSIDLGIIEAKSVQDIVAMALKSIHQIIPCQEIELALLDEDKNEVIIFARQNELDSPIKAGHRIPIPPNLFEAFNGQQIWMDNDVQVHSDIHPNYEKLIEGKVGSFLQILLVIQEHPIGVLTMKARIPGFFTQQHQQFAVQVVSQLAIAVKQAQLTEKLTQHTNQLDEMREFWQTSFDSFPANAAVLAPDGTILNVNLGWQRFAEENEASSKTFFLNDNYLTVCDTTVDEASAAAVGIRAVIRGDQEDFYLEYPCHSLTAERWFMLRVTPFAEPAPRRVVVAHINITERMLAERVEREQFQLIKAMRDSLVILTASHDMDTVMQQILDFSGKVIPSEAGTIILFEGDYGRVGYWRGYSEETQTFFKTNLLPFGKDLFDNRQGSQGYYLAEDTQKTPDWVSYPETDWIRSSVGVPIVVRGEAIGILVADSSIPNRFHQKDVENLQSFAHYAALALENAQYVNRLEQKVQERTAELVTAKERVEAILDNNADAILLIHGDLRIQQANTSFERLFACEPDEYFGQSLKTLVTDAYHHQINHALDLVKTQPNVNLEVVALRKDGTAFDAEMSLGQIQDEGFVCTIRDISERLRSQSLLETERKLLRILIDASPDYIYLKDTKHRFLLTNAALAHARGVDDPEEMLGKSDADFFSPELTEQFHSEEEMIFKTGKPLLNHEQSSKGYAGGFAWSLSNKVPLVNSEGEVLGLAGVTRDITERKQHEEELRFQAAIQANMSDAVIVTDMEYRILSWNKAAEEIYGWSANDVVGKASATILQTRYESDTNREKVTQDFLKQGWWQGEVIQSRKSGSDIYIRASVTLLKDEQGEPKGIVSVNYDITERKQAEILLEARLKEDHEFQDHLTALHQISIDLTQVDQLDEFYRNIVELGRERLGFKRIALFLYEPQSGFAQGTYGTDLQGQTVDEQYIRFIPHETGILQQALEAYERFSFHREATLYNHNQIIGQGWNAAAALWSGSEGLGWLIIDDAIDQQPATRPILDTLALYALSISSLLVRKREQVILRESEARYRLLAENVTDVIIKITWGGDRTFITPSCYDLLGYTAEEMLLKPQLKFTHPDDHAGVMAIIHEAAKAGASTALVTQRLRHKNGHYIWVEVKETLIYDPVTKKLIELIGVIRDISKRKEAEDALQKYTAEVHDLYNNAPCGYHSVNQDGLIVQINDTELNWLGYTREEVVGILNFRDILTPESRVSFVQQFQVFLEQGWISEVEVDLVCKDGSVLPVIASATAIRDDLGNFLQSRTTLFDISDRKIAEQALRKSEEKYRSLIETMRGGLAMYDLQDRITYVNDRFCEMLGYTRAELVGKTSFEYVDERNAEKIRQHVEQRKQEQSTTYELVVQHKNGQDIHVLVSGSPLFDEEGVLIGSFAVTTDITDQKNAEKALQAALEKERDLNDLKTRFVSMASHEFRTPLASILALTETIKAYRQKMSDEQIEKRIDSIQSQVEHLKEIMDDVLQLARMQAGRVKFDPVLLDLDSLCRSVIDEFESQPSNAHRIKYFCDETLQRVHLDKKLMRQIINNLVSNAIKYSPSGQNIGINLQYTSPSLIIKISDEGIGIPHEDLAHLFEPFHRATNVETIPGTGLGLVIIKEAVELHQGTISVESEVDIGTTFTIVIPIEGVEQNGESIGN